MKALLAAFGLLFALAGCGAEEESRVDDDLVLPAIY